MPSGSITRPTLVPGSVASVGNLLAPSSGLARDGMSPIPLFVDGGNSSSTEGVPPHTSGGHTGPPLDQNVAPYNFQSGTTVQGLLPRDGLFHPNSLGDATQSNTNSPYTTGGLPPHLYGVSLPPCPSSTSMSIPTASSLVSQPQVPNTTMDMYTPGLAATTPRSPVHTRETCYNPQPPPTPIWYSGSQSSFTPQQQHFLFPPKPSPTLHGPMIADGPLPRMSPQGTQGPVSLIPAAPGQSCQPYQRPFGHYGPEAVKSKTNNPNRRMAVIGGMLMGIDEGCKSGRAASIPHTYGNHSQRGPPTNDRPFKCDQCLQSFHRSYELKRHKGTHLAVKPFSCRYCNRRFSRSDALTRHWLVKDCGKAHAAAKAEKQDGSISCEGMSS